MSALIQFIVWEWINVALEYTAVSWARLPRLFWTVVDVNLVPHPLFTLLLARFGLVAFVMNAASYGTGLQSVRERLLFAPLV